MKTAPKYKAMRRSLIGFELVKLEIHRDCLVLRMESDIERAFVEDTLGLRNGGDSVDLVRIERRTEDRILDVWLETHMRPGRSKGRGK